MRLIIVAIVLISCTPQNETVFYERHPCMTRDMFLPQPFPPFPPQGKSDTPSHPISEWGMLARGKTLGKRTIHTATGSFQSGFSPVDILTLQADDEYALNLNICLCPPKYFEGTLPADVQSLSTTQTNTQLQAAQPFQIPRLFAIIDWGIGGVSNTAEVDFANGANLNLSATFLRIRGSLDTESITDNRFDAYELSAFVGPGMPRNVVAQRTHFDSVAAAGRSAVQAVPPFAKSVSGVAWVDNTDPPTVLAPTIVFYMANAQAAAHVIGHWILTPNVRIAIPSNAAFFQVVNPDAANLMRVNTIFELAL